MNTDMLQDPIHC